MERENRAASTALQMSGISKTFNSSVRALKTVDLEIRPGEIHALLGENGAGKSTLMNILGGVLQSDEGEIRRNNELVTIPDSLAAEKLGIAFIHQELNLVPDLSVYENMYLGDELRTRIGTLDTRAMIEGAQRVFRKLNMNIDPSAIVRDLPATEKQVVEIAGALLQDADLIIMDEPTTSLTSHEIEAVFDVMRTLRSRGVSIIFISHKLGEVMEICDRFTVLRDGVVSGTGDVSQITEDGLVQLMVGRELADVRFLSHVDTSEALVEVTGLTSEPVYRDISFTVHKGEVVGFTGLAGDGRSEVFETIFGARRADAGTVRIKGRPATIRLPKDATRIGIGYAPKNRKENAIIKDLSIAHNVSLASLGGLCTLGVVRQREELTRVKKHVSRMSLRYGALNDPITSLSGGNQQKAVLARWLEADSDIIILDNPTQGIDVGAKAEIYEILSELASQGRAVIVLSSEFAEIARLCDRTYVMYHGSIVAELDRDRLSEETVMGFSTGVLGRTSSTTHEEQLDD